ncbi:MAG: hypothetical protein A3G32_09125 [Deltaproteobacteria bacterium RIFCSPLOWO2_12_FULL_40_28]|nr:MAG: hypothetical protein A3C45_07980 [Deltaproteobacteria bacterium RIFCSPHIGHO2_02_FULL_40_28]OGQ21182.1 MAG: hypothetical protein A3E27_01615 [Deltaproteobacteria bacterium RIFCSPHIGHO2_12_FULL_40_32]OGQ39083.1 MAG: hypothetical protein A3I69_09250 [Deltaproteobacteria bacterium RIFCSPLOWO2_02_FULL_40_36]OGQ53156.1 MAG: hypothetical protein A3G32_09125 [Deltaproteobacteria bacterium RIFCSPLOWO2_12_FULL_40_28]
MNVEQSLNNLDEYLGKEVQIVAYGASYIGSILNIDHEKGFVQISDGKDTVKLDLDFVTSFTVLDTDSN